MLAARHEAADADLLTAVAAGDELSFAEVRRRYRSRVERVCRLVVRFDAEDCVQEVFARVWFKAELFDRRKGSPSAWLLTLARNVARNLGARPAPLPHEPVDVAGESPPVDERLWLDRALRELPARERAVIELAYFKGLSQPEIAEHLGAPLGSVKSWTRRGLNRLADSLGDPA
jgi:RNA polymerase sigma-70 factor (ECF subfamily)